MMDNFLEGISLENRVIFMRRYWFCETYTEIAMRYGISKHKVKRQIQETHQHLSDYLNRVGSTFDMNHVDDKFVREAESTTILRDEKLWLLHIHSIFVNSAKYVISRLFCCSRTKLYERS